MTTLLESTAALVSKSRALIIESRHRVVRVREAVGVHARQRRLKPIRGGIDESAIRQRVRQELASGALARLDGGRSWAGRGTGRLCRMCDQPIDESQVELEVETPEPVVLHRDCFFIWQQESVRRSP